MFKKQAYNVEQHDDAKKQFPPQEQHNSVFHS